MDNKMKLNNIQKVSILLKILEITEGNKEVVFSVDHYTKYFGQINKFIVESYLHSLAKKGYIHFGIFADGDGFIGEADLSLKDREGLTNELNIILKEIERHSTHKEKNRKIIYSYFPIMLSMFGIMATIIPFLMSKTNFSSNTLSNNPYQMFSFILMAMVAVISLMALMIGITTLLRTRRKEESDNEIDEYSYKLKNTVLSHEVAHIIAESNKNNNDNPVQKEEKKVDETDALRLMVVNMEEIKAYYTLSKKQATSSFHLAIWMCILGFLLMVSAVVVPLFSNWNIQISIISAVGGAIVELFAGTTLLVYRTSLTQLNHYYKSLHENERFLSCANLIRKLSSTDAQDEMYKELIRSEMTKSVNAFNEQEAKQ